MPGDPSQTDHSLDPRSYSLAGGCVYRVSNAERRSAAECGATLHGADSTRQARVLALDLLGRGVVVVLAARGGGASRSSRPGPPDDHEATGDVAAHQVPDDCSRRWDQEDQAEDVGDEAGGEQEGAADRDQQPVGDLPAREAALGQGGVEAAPGAAALVAQ